MDEHVWRKVDNMAVMCDECKCNIQQALYSEDRIVGREQVCNAEDNICVRLNKPIQNDRKAYDDFKDIFNDPEWPMEEENG